MKTLLMNVNQYKTVHNASFLTRRLGASQIDFPLSQLHMLAHLMHSSSLLPQLPAKLECNYNQSAPAAQFAVILAIAMVNSNVPTPTFKMAAAPNVRKYDAIVAIAGTAIMV